MIHFVRDGDVAKIELHAGGMVGASAGLAALSEPSVIKLNLQGRQKAQQAPDYLGIWRITTHEEIETALKDRIAEP
jgi:hypothetical protein